MGREYLTLGATPPGETCAQVGSENYHQKVMRECRIYIEQIRRIFGQDPPGTNLAIKGFNHDFGTYHEVVIYYDPLDQVSLDYAFKIESDGPMEWDQEAKEQIALAEENP